ncbi:MAG: threonine synthase, partial [Candidatus Eremiobacteraeota bacterium]|nr:threonine synthase [Candidatus Eremiobacteraeota bacterium]
FCEACGGLLAFALDPAAHDPAALRRRFAERRLSNDPLDTSGVWRFRELLPPISREAVVSLRENALPVYDAVRGAAYASATRTTYLHLGMNPTASFKDAGMTVAISHAKASGARVAVCASTGNTAAAMAAYAARAEIAALVLVPAVGVSEAKMAQTLDYGATVVAIDGDFDRALAVVRNLDPRRVAIVNSVNPFRIEGQKCAAFALLEARNWRVPDWIVLPGGNLGNTSAFGKGLREALALGLIDRLPRIVVVQAAGAAPFANVFRDGGELVPVRAETTATAIKIGDPASWRKALSEVAATQGTVLAVTDDAIADARAIVGRDGVGCEPASAASLAGLRELRAAGTIGRDDDVVLVLTGHVLKDGAYAAAYHTSGARFANAIRSAPTEALLQALIDEVVAVRA